MKKTQTIVDRERLNSDYIESKQDFSNVLYQVKSLPTTTWKNPWFYGPIGLAVVAVTVSIVSLNPTTAVAGLDNRKDGLKQTEQMKPNQEVKLNAISKQDVKEKSIEPLQINKTDKDVKTIQIEKTTREVSIIETKEIIDNSTEIVTNQAKVERKIPANNKFPFIDGYFTGEIPVESLFDKNGILLNETVEVVSFDLNFFTGRSNVVNQIKGNKIPEEMRSMITNFNMGKTIFITNIKAFDREGRSYTLPSMNFKPI